jgi:Na+/proline symporter
MMVVSIVFVLYLLLVMVVGAVASRYGRTMEGYFLADRNLGSWVTAISSVASSESGWLVIGLVGMAYVWGAQAIWTVPGVLLGYVCNWYLVAPRLRQQSAALGAITIPGYLQARFGDRWNLIRIIGILIILFCMMFYVAAQFTATGKAFQMAFGKTYGITYTHGVLIGGLITVIYTFVGGFRAVSWTDLIQGLLMAFGLVVLPIVTIVSVGGFGTLFDNLARVSPRVEAVMTDYQGTSVSQFGIEEQPVVIGRGVTLQRELGNDDSYHFQIEILPESESVYINDVSISETKAIAAGDEIQLPDGQEPRRVVFEKVESMVGGRDMIDILGGASGLGLMGWVAGLLGIGLGYPGQPHVLTRYMAAKSQCALNKARIIAIVWGVFALNGAVILGLAARLAIPDLVDPEQAYPSLATSHLPPILGGILLAAIISAMMSTADSQLLVVSSAVARDLIDKTMNLRSRLAPENVEKTLVWITRATVLVVGLLSLALALAEVHMVFWFVLFAWSGLGAAFGPPILLGLFWRKVNTWGAVAGMLTGFIVTVLWKLKLQAWLSSETGLSLYELVPAFFLALFATWFVSLATGGAKEVPEGLHGLESNME